MRAKEVISLKVKSLVDLNSTLLLLACQKKHHKRLLTEWYRLLEIYPLLCDLRSDVIETTGRPLLQKSLENLNKRGDLPYGQPVPDQKCFVILFTEKFFEKNEQISKAIILHELGHFFVYQTGMLGNLRNNWPAGEDMFDVFVSVVKQDPNWYKKVKEWLRRFYQYYVFDILKIPGEIYANIWVKDNFNNVVDLAVDSQVENLEHLAINIEKTSETKLIKFPLLSIVLRLEGLLRLMNGNQNRNVEKIHQILDLCWKRMSKYLLPSEMEAFSRVKEEVMRICSSPQTADEQLFDFYEKFVNNNILEQGDFL